MNMKCWIDINDELPEPGIEVVWIYATDEMTVYARDHDDDMTGHVPAITHWMKPEPPDRKQNQPRQ